MATIDIQKVNTKTLQDILDACEKTFPSELNIKDFYGQGQTTWAIPEVGLVYKDTSSKSDLLEFVETLTSTKDIKQAYATIFQEIESRKGRENKDIPEGLDKTTLDAAESETLIAEAEERQKQINEAQAISDKAVDEFLKRQKEIYEQRIKLKQDVLVIPTEDIQKITLEKEEKEKLYNLAKAAELDPATVQDELRNKIHEALDKSSEEIKNNIPEEIVTRVTADLIEKTKPYALLEKAEDIPDILPTLNSASPFTATSPFDEYSQTLAVALEAETNLYTTLTSSILDSESISNLLYSSNHITNFEIAENQEREDGIRLDPEEIFEQAKKVKEVWQKLSNKTATAQDIYSSTSSYIVPYTRSGVPSVVKEAKSLTLRALPSTVGAVYGLRQGILMSQWARNGVPLLMNSQVAGLLSGSLDMAAASSSVIMSRPTQLVLGRFAIGIQTGVTTQGHQVALAGVSFGQKFTGVMAVKSGTQVLVGTASTAAGAEVAVGASSLATKVLTFLGGVSTPFSAGIGLVVGYISGKIVEYLPKIKEWFSKNGGVLGLGAGIGGSLIFGPGVGTLLGLGTMAATGTLAAFINGALSALQFIGSSFLSAVAGPVIATAIAVPLLVAFIMVVINSGAYVVPPSLQSTGGGSTPADCLGEPPEKPSANNLVRFSSDGNYAYPVAPFPGNPYDSGSCYHWDGNLAADLFSPQKHPPVVAFEKGKIVNVTLNDSIGGKYIILQGTTSGRHYYYAHLCHTYVKSGESVNVGDVIGTMDETGTGRVQHLHFAINKTPLGSNFIGGDGNVCPFEDFENKFKFGICNPSSYCVK